MIIPSTNNAEKRRIALSLQYEGTSFSGWQRQPELLTVQGVLEDAISQLDPGRPINVVGAGRTDAGVHAAGQVAHFDYCGPIPAERWAPALNGRLPASIRVRESVLQPTSWHACHSALYRRYRYMIYNGRRPNLFLAPWSWHRYQVRLDEDLMSLGLSGLLGTHDFSAFQRAGSSRANAYTTIQTINLERRGDLLEMEVQASGFLYGMVRLLVGQLIALGEHRITLETFEHRWRNRLRLEVKEAAPPHGLCFLCAGYEETLFSKETQAVSMPRFTLSTNDPPVASS